MDERARHTLSLQSQFEQERYNFDSLWQETAQLVMTRHDEFNRDRGNTIGEKRKQYIFDATAPLALDRFAAVIDSLITPATQQWHRLLPEDPALQKNKRVMVYLDDLTKLLFRIRYRPEANFSAQAYECYQTLGAFGTLAMFITDIVGRGPRYKSIPISQMYLAEDVAGMVRRVHRKFELTTLQALEFFKEDNLPQRIIDAKEKSPLARWEFIHACYPWADVSDKDEKDGNQYVSRYVAIEGNQLVSEGGYRTFPYAVSRYITAPNEKYGRGPATEVLPDIKMVNQIEKSLIRAAHRRVEPPLLVAGDGMLRPFSMRPNAINYGGLDMNGNPMVQPLDTGANLPVGFEMAEQKRQAINDAFLVTLFQILVENPRMTATEAMLRAQEKGQLLGPIAGRQQTEFLGTLIPRELDIMAEYGMIPPPPKELMTDDGLNIKVEYSSTLTRFRRSEDAVSILRTLESLTPVANIRPEVMDIFDFDALARELVEINGVPAVVLRDEEGIARIREQQEQQQTQAADLQNAEVASKAAKNTAQAAQAAGFSPGIEETL